jgi:hypothetical protein
LMFKPNIAIDGCSHVALLSPWLTRDV